MKSDRARYLNQMEIGGIVFCLAAAFLMRRLYLWSGRELIGVLFGAVNDSPWEQIKILLLPYLLWGMLEMLSLQPSLHRLTAAKTVSLYLLAALLLGGSAILRRLELGTDSPLFFALCVGALCAAAAMSALVFRSERDLRPLFMPCVFLLFLFVACYFSFTPFPPRHALFYDEIAGRYGLLPSEFW